MTKLDEAKLSTVAELLKSARSAAVLTGAGVSKESGIPTFREAQSGLWANYDPQTLATPEGFLKDPKLVWQWYDHRRRTVQTVQPNPGHYAIAQLQKIMPLTVITQNVDGLHERAGAKGVIELHGSILRFVCFDRRHVVPDVPEGLENPPKCHCGSLVRPAVVWFGEMLPLDAMKQASAAVEGADVVLVVGTSGLVQPAASLPFMARSAGATLVEINPDITPISDSVDFFLQGQSGIVLPALMNLIQEKSK